MLAQMKDKKINFGAHYLLFSSVRAVPFERFARLQGSRVDVVLDAR